MGIFFGWTSFPLRFPPCLCLKPCASTIEGVARGEKRVAGRGLKHELWQNSERGWSLTKSLSPPSIFVEAALLIHLPFPDKEKRQPSLLHADETHLCYLPSLWELETFLRSAHPSNMLWSFLRLSWNRRRSALRWVSAVGLGLRPGMSWAPWPAQHQELLPPSSALCALRQQLDPALMLPRFSVSCDTGRQLSGLV